MFKKKILILTTILLAFLVISFLLKNTFFNSSNQKPKTENISKITYSCDKDKSAFESLMKNTHSLEVESTSMGAIITAINDVKQGNGKYWQYSINDQYAQVSAAAYKCQGGEIITWELK